MKEYKADQAKYSDLNEQVEALLKKPRCEIGNEREIKRRQRKNKDQLKVLDIEFQKNPHWDREYIRVMAQKLGLRECQIYKWHWDQIKKHGIETSL